MYDDCYTECAMLQVPERVPGVVSHGEPPAAGDATVGVDGGVGAVTRIYRCAAVVDGALRFMTPAAFFVRAGCYNGGGRVAGSGERRFFGPPVSFTFDVRRDGPPLCVVVICAFCGVGCGSCTCLPGREVRVVVSVDLGLCFGLRVFPASHGRFSAQASPTSGHCEFGRCFAQSICGAH